MGGICGVDAGNGDFKREAGQRRMSTQPIEFWVLKHSDAFHPGSRQECEHCQLMISLYGEMPSPEQIMAASLQNPPSRTKLPIPVSLRWFIWERDNFTCRECGSRQKLTVDHIIPESKGGTLDPDNLQTLCHRCNCRKGAQ